MGTNVSTNYINAPLDPKKTLCIKLPFLVMIIKNLKKYFTFEASSTIGQEPILGGPGNGYKALLHINIRLLQSLPEFNPKLLRKFLPFFCRDHLLVCYVTLISHQDFVHVYVGVLLNL